MYASLHHSSLLSKKADKRFNLVVSRFLKYVYMLLIFITILHNYCEKTVISFFKTFVSWNLMSVFTMKAYITFSSLSHINVFSFFAFYFRYRDREKLFTHKCEKITNFCLKWRGHENFPFFFFSFQLHFLSFFSSLSFFSLRYLFECSLLF